LWLVKEQGEKIRVQSENGNVASVSIYSRIRKRSESLSKIIGRDQGFFLSSVLFVLQTPWLLVPLFGKSDLVTVPLTAPQEDSSPYLNKDSQKKQEATFNIFV
jgi:hypothetical protein